MKMKTHEARLQKEGDSEVAVMFSKLRTKSEKPNSKQSPKPRMSPDSGSESDGSGSEDEKHRRTNWKDIQECYRCHEVRQIARYCLSTSSVERADTADTAAAAATTTTSIENYWMTITNGNTPSKESW